MIVLIFDIYILHGKEKKFNDGVKEMMVHMDSNEMLLIFSYNLWFPYEEASVFMYTDELMDIVCHKREIYP